MYLLENLLYMLLALVSHITFLLDNNVLEIFKQGKLTGCYMKKELQEDNSGSRRIN